MSKDACQVHIGHSPRALAAFRNAILYMFQQKDWTNIAAALR
jgi:hypothetical protein